VGLAEAERDQHQSNRESEDSPRNAIELDHGGEGGATAGNDDGKNAKQRGSTGTDPECALGRFPP